MNDIRWKRGGRRGRRGGGGGGAGRCPITSMGAINLRMSFLPFKRSTRDLVNIWDLAWW